MERKKKVFIIILSFNGKEDTLDCLKTCSKLSVVSCQLSVIVVDNNSSDGSVKAIKSKFPKIKLIKNQINKGFAEGNNVGIRYSLKHGADYCLILNNDTLINKSFLVQLVSRINAGSASGRKKDKKIGVISPKIYFAPGFEFHKNRYKKDEQGKIIWYAGGKMDWKNVLASHRGVDEVDIGRYQKAKETDFATGCCMLVKKEVFEKIGLFNKKYFLYWEDNDFCQRAKRAGFKVYFDPDAFIWHKNAGSSGSGSSLHDYYITRNRLLFAFKYASLRAKIALIKESLIKLFKGRNWEKKGIIDFYLRRFGKGSWK